MRALAFHIGSFVIFAVLIAASGYTSVWIGRKTGRWWIGLICFFALFYGSTTYLAFDGLPLPSGEYGED
ncbi:MULTISPECIES: hypothetical protein [Burkholderia]|uniref:hypothetical protein n=1 Tax=Burkholderia TaxID=32008 RepID=UPI0008695105|nr:MULTISPECIES: hypothetical protein [Burkholderia]MDP9549675.1 hypothetical protein [Burkholderia cepacia]MBR8393375.1 hypothetical protein [Burkholderia cenocepacia]MBR8473294.1 hypothetical protein [Burkholderia cenocepacia]MBR8491749.1 hypothetical protein [Burkholderia cenocepacia]MDO5919714.1 hypothetical protein [Burkholderia cenocepacia]